jgi:histidinol-phosphatase (PHP family)
VIASYHNHTTWSDGAASVRETLAAARAQGLDEVGISDHWVLDPRGDTPGWSMDPEALWAYVEEVRACQPGATPTLRLGLEVDWFPGHGDAIAARLAEHDFDYLIGSVHTLDGFRADSYLQIWESLPVVERDAMHRRYWRSIADMAGSGLFDIVGHLDLTKKFNQHPTVDLSAEIDEALDAIATAGMAVEVNTSGWGYPCDDAYPAADLLCACRERDIPALISADAHVPERLRWDFDRGAARLSEVGYEEIVLFEGRRRTTAPLPFSPSRG